MTQRQCFVTYSDCASASLGSVGASATRYRRAEYVSVVAIVIAPFELGNVQRQIFAADYVKTSHDAALQERLEAIDCLSVDCAVDVLASAMPHNAMLFQLMIAGVIVGRDQANFFGNSFANEAVQCCSVGVVDDASHDIALALHGAQNGFFAVATSSWSALIPMPVFVLAADISFINFDNAHELAEFRFGEAAADAMAHIVRGRVGAETKHPMHLHRGNALLAGQHKIDDLEPSPHRNIRVFEDRSDKHGESIAERGTLPTLPVEWPLNQFSNIFAPATRTPNTMRPTPRNEIGFACNVGRKQPIELCNSHLFCELWAGHRSAPDV
jgi:hypothetical protein